MEALLNLSWAIAAISIIIGIGLGVHFGRINAPMGKALTAAIVLAFVLLPVVSISDDIAVLHKLMESEDGDQRRMDALASMNFVLPCLEMLCVAMTLLATLFALRRLRVLQRSAARPGFYVSLALPSVAGVRPPPSPAIA